MDILELINQIENLEAKLTDGYIQDSDTVLDDILEEAESEVTGIAHEIFDIYKKCKDTDSFQELFESLTGVTFLDYLNRCKNTIKKNLEANE